MSKPSLPSGTRDFAPETLRKRNYIFQTIRRVFENYGFQPLETPAMENLDTLMGKYGEEGDKLIFKILNNGLGEPKNREKSIEAFQQVLAGRNDKNLTERALRYDLTIPFARFVAMNHGQLAMPFKRYQMQPVWRADRPQKGRYREFWQCDADVVGSRALLNEVELTAMYAEVFERLDIAVEIRVNSRKLLAALAEACGGSDKLTDITVAIDKLDKIGIDKVREEILERGLSAAQWELVERYLSITGDNENRFAAASTLLENIPLAAEGLQELRTLLDNEPPANLVLDFTLARGLNYYTGIIFEIKARDVAMGSIGGGGRYDDLTGLFGLPGIPGVGISFGVDRIYDVMDSLNAFPEEVHSGTKALFFNLGAAEARTAFKLVQFLRSADYPCELYHEPAKFDRQFRYAEKKQIPFVVIIGSQELESGACLVKDQRTGKQVSVLQSELAAYLLR